MTASNILQALTFVAALILCASAEAIADLIQIVIR